MSTIPQDNHLATALPGPRAQALEARAAAALPRAMTAAMATFAERTDRGILEDVDGNRLIDFGSGIAVTTVGGAAPQVAAAVCEQVGRLTHTSFAITRYAGYVELAERLNALAPGDAPKKTALFNSGAEAVENAVKIARRASGRQAIVCFDHAFHGRTALTMGLTAKAVPYKDGFGPFAPELYRVPTSYPFLDGLDGPAAASRAIAAIESQVGASRTAAVIIEPIQGEGGFIVPAPGFLATLQRWCADNDVIFIADEIQTGIARTGAWFACEHEGVVPDMVTTAKGLAGGMPLSAVTARAEIMDSVPPGGLGGTYCGNPVACAAALAVLDMIESQGLLARARDLGERGMERLRGWQETMAQVGDVRGRGAMMALELTDPRTGAPDAALTGQVAQRARAAGLILLTCGTRGNVIRLLPPVTMDDSLFDRGMDILADCLESAIQDRAEA
ncbi:4-aminobutyrate--2-oxoglutarate transaminase [Actinomyces slackii]|uniref:(S)-3-amino-2-methylpropionate transaminase n=1 Tax=Actinomyces slackii TaxID=52774 RepID=A0A448KAF6_9ACTO|nr:4-aminobutyrate--2-oxoglutarate transaminase [Actinomyces slackii]VEG73906.1 4-aminobutyrate aminotransferase PuuE [Actinomyces slackii]